MYFILKGKVQLLITGSGKNQRNRNQKTVLRDLNEDSVFGELSFFTGKERNCTAQSKDFTTMFLIKREDFLKILMENRDDYVKNKKFYRILYFYRRNIV